MPGEQQQPYEEPGPAGMVREREERAGQVVVVVVVVRTRGHEVVPGVDHSHATC